jgi:hypothetical protein
MKFTVAAIGVICAILYYYFSPLEYDVKFLITGNVYAKSCPSPTTPRLKLQTIRSCSEVDKEKEPCIVRNGVSKEQLDAFMTGSGHNGFVVKQMGTTEAIGNPLMEPYGLDAEKRIYCTLNDLVEKNEKCKNMYAGFRSLNYSDYLPLNNSNVDLNDVTRSDIFIGYPATTQVTAGFHSNNFEKSITVQIVGEKVWLTMRPEDFFGVLGGYSIGAYNAARDVCVNQLEKFEMQTVRTGPGDILSFPKAWPHHIYSIAGPNIMINFRGVEVRPTPRDILSVLSAIVGGRKAGFLDANYCDQDLMAPTSYGMNNPRPHLLQKAHMRFDMRCTDVFNNNIYNYKKLAREVSVQRPEIDQAIFDQVTAYIADAY